MSRRHGAKHPNLIRAKAELADKQKLFLKEFDLVRSAQADKDYRENKQDPWHQPELDEATHLQIAKRLIKARTTVLKREIESQQGGYDAIVSKSRDDAVNDIILSHIDLATVPEKPISTQRGGVIATGSFAGLGSGFLVALLLSRLGSRAKS